MKDRTCQESPDPAEGERPEDARRRGTASARCGGEHGVAQVETDAWMERVLDPVNMKMAWKRVRRNKGAPGIDGMTVGDFPEFAREHWDIIGLPRRDSASLNAKPLRRASRREDKQWKRSRTRRRNLLKLGADPKTVHMATRSRKGYWRLSMSSIVCKALSVRWLKEQGVPEMREIWIKLHYGDK
jgi:hypothetical protein